MERSYTITLKNETQSEQAERNPIAGSGAQTQNGDSGGVASWRKGVAKGIVTFNTYVKPFVDQLVTQQISTITLRTGAEELQEKAEFAYSAIKAGVGLIESVLIGGLVGNLPGAVIGGLMSISTTAISYANKAQTLNLQRSVESMSLRNMEIRAGGSLATFSGSRGRSQ